MVASHPHPSTDAALPEAAPSGFISDIVSNIMNGGVHPSLIIGMHASFLALFLVLVALWVLTTFNGHVLALAGISLCLWGSTTWFVMELLDAQNKQKEEDAANAKLAPAEGEEGKQGGNESMTTAPLEGNNTSEREEPKKDR